MNDSVGDLIRTHLNFEFIEKLSKQNIALKNKHYNSQYKYTIH